MVESRGIGIIAVVIAFALVMLGGTGSYFYIKQVQQKEMEPAEVPMTEEKSETQIVSPVVETEKEVAVTTTVDAPVPKPPQVTLPPVPVIDQYGGRYVTPNGTPLIQQPSGWIASSILQDIPPRAFVFFTNPSQTLSMQVGVGMPMKESDNPQAAAERLINLYTGSGTVQGISIHGELTRKDEVRIGKAWGYKIEINRTDLSGEWKILYMVVATSGPDYLYEVSSKVPIKEWEQNKAMLEASFDTLWVQ